MRRRQQFGQETHCTSSGLSFQYQLEVLHSVPSREPFDESDFWEENFYVIFFFCGIQLQRALAD